MPWTRHRRLGGQRPSQLERGRRTSGCFRQRRTGGGARGCGADAGARLRHRSAEAKRCGGDRPLFSRSVRPPLRPRRGTRRYWDKVEAGELIPAVARDGEGEVIGHIALEREPGMQVAERGEAVVRSAHRGHGLLELMTNIEFTSLSAVFGTWFGTLL